jgi:hypothetical protein
MPSYELEPLLQQIRARVLELRQLEGDGADRASLAVRWDEINRLKARLAAVVGREAVAA